MRIADVLFSTENELFSSQQLFEKHAAAMGHHEFLADLVDLHVIRHYNGRSELKKGNCNYHFFKGSPSKFRVPVRLLRFINRLAPDVIVVHGFFDPLQTLLLTLQTRAKIVLQYHGGGQPGGLTGMLQKIVNRRVDAFIFTAVTQATPFIRSGFLPANSVVRQVMEGSNSFKKTNRSIARKELNLKGHPIFLWVGTLNENKDPLTVLNAFEILARENSGISLYMIFNGEELLHEVSEKISSSAILKGNAHLVGKVPAKKVEQYMNAADFFVLGSHYEGSGYSLCEALACGCIPLVTDIPSFRMMTDNGQLGALWECGNRESLLFAARQCMQKTLEDESEKCARYFNEELSYEAISKRFYAIFEEHYQVHK